MKLIEERINKALGALIDLELALEQVRDDSALGQVSNWVEDLQIIRDRHRKE